MILERNPFPMEKNNKQFRTSIGGQALIEGILMRGPEKQAIVVRSPEGLVTKVEELTLIKDKYPILGWPILRGAVTFLDSMVRGVKALMFSADYYPEDENVQPSKLDKWLEEHVPAAKHTSSRASRVAASIPACRRDRRISRVRSLYVTAITRRPFLAPPAAPASRPRWPPPAWSRPARWW